jgi:hypothetical protein
MENGNKVKQELSYLIPEIFGAKGDGVNDDTSAIQAMHDTFPKEVRYTGNYNITAPIRVSSDCNIIISGEIKINRHGFRAFVLEFVHNVSFQGKGKITGYGLFPDKNIASVQGEGEKRFCFDKRKNFPAGYDEYDTSLGVFGDGYIGNGGCGIFIYGGGDITIKEVEISGFNFSGISIGDAIMNNVPSQPIIGNVQIECIIHDCYDNGVSMLSCKNIYVGKNHLTYNIGHPDAGAEDYSVNPGYGITGRLVGDKGNPVRGAYISGTYLNIKRKALDVHSGFDIHFHDVYVRQSYITGLSISKGYTGNISLKDGYIENCGLKPESTIEHRSGVMIWCDEATLENVEIINSGTTQSLLVLDALDTQISNIIIKGNGLSGRPINFTRATDFLIKNLVILGSFQLPLLFQKSKGKAIGINSREMVKNIINEPDIQFLGENHVDIKDSSYSYPLIQRTENIGDYFNAESIVKLIFEGASGVNSEVLDGSRYISAISTGSSSVEILGISGSRNYQNINSTATAIIEDISVARVNYSKISLLGLASSNLQKLSISIFDEENEKILINSELINGLTMVVRIQWAFNI